MYVTRDRVRFAIQISGRHKCLKGLTSDLALAGVVMLLFLKWQRFWHGKFVSYIEIKYTCSYKMMENYNKNEKSTCSCKTKNVRWEPTKIKDKIVFSAATCCK